MSKIVQLPKKKNKVNALLVKLSIGIFSNSRQDPEITQDVKKRRKLGIGAGKWVKYKLPDKCLEPLRKFAGEVRTWHYNHTSPWEEGYRLLGAKLNEKYEQQMVKFAARFYELVEQFLKQYPQYIEAAKTMHGPTFELSDYPSRGAMKAQFHIGREYYPVPKPEHFNAGMQELYGTALTAITEKKIGDAVTDTWGRLMKPVLDMAQKLSSPEKIFRDTLVENVKEMVALVPELNLTDDPKLMEAALIIEKELAALDVEKLREDKVVRKDAAEKAKNILARFGGVGKRKLAA